MLTEQLERRVRGGSLVELINKPLDMSQQVEHGAGLEDEYQPAIQVSQGSHKPAVMQPDSTNLPMVCPKLENQKHPTSEAAETPRSPPGSDSEQRCTCHSSASFLTIMSSIINTKITTRSRIRPKHPGAMIMRRKRAHLHLSQGCQH